MFMLRADLVEITVGQAGKCLRSTKLGCLYRCNTVRL